jgi:hypothetical protein
MERERSADTVRETEVDGLGQPVIEPFGDPPRGPAVAAATSDSSTPVRASPVACRTAGSAADVSVRDDVFKRLMVWGMTIMVVAPVLTWLILVVPGGLSSRRREPPARQAGLGVAARSCR